MALVSPGFNSGPADGLFGPRTRVAVRGYQREKGYAQTGYLTGEETEALVVLGEEAERVAEERRQTNADGQLVSGHQNQIRIRRGRMTLTWHFAAMDIASALKSS